MKPFDNVTSDGNEKAIRKGRVVPEGDVNLAYVRAPELSPKENVVVVDTSRITEENVASGTRAKKLYYANPIGVLVDENNNAAIGDQYPVVTDVFFIDEDYSLTPGSEYTNDSILPYRHVSRYFHLDHAGLVMGDDVISYVHDNVRVVNEQGDEYNNYRIKITPVLIKDYTPDSSTAATWAYRVYAYIDTDQNNLYLTYNKIEIENDGRLVRRQIGYQEILNPQPFFDYTPEESDVVDPANREEKLYSSKPVTHKQEVLGQALASTEGYRIYVPKKAVGDPRLYQLFRWRITCNFQQSITVDPSRNFDKIRCGVLVTTSELATGTPSLSPYAFLNLQRSRYNAARVEFQNPARSTHASAEKETRDYWFVNIDTDDLSQYDILIWSPPGHRFNLDPYSAKIDDFVNNHGGTVFIDTNTHADPNTSFGGQTTMGINPISGSRRTSITNNSNTTPVRADFPRWGEETHPLLNANAILGGWDYDTDIAERIFVAGMKIANYNGNAEITRGGVLGALYVIGQGIEGFEMPAPRTGAFPDVNAGTPNGEAIEVMAAMGVARGRTDGLFSPHETARRVHVAAFVDAFYSVVASQFGPISPIPTGDINHYTDVPANSMWADILRRMNRAGIMIGFASIASTGLQVVRPTGQRGPAPGDPNYTTDAQIRQRIRDIYAHRGLQVPSNFEAQVQRVKDDGTGYFGYIRNHAERDATNSVGTPLPGWGFASGTYFGLQNTITHTQLANTLSRLVSYLQSQAPGDFVSAIDPSKNIYFTSYTQSGNRKYSQNFDKKPSGYATILECRVAPDTNVHRDVTIAKQIGKGHKILSTFGHLHTCNMYLNDRNNSIVSSNTGSTLASNSNYNNYINGRGVDGAMKLLYNASLLAVRARALDTSDQESFTSEWSYSTPWKASWVIDASDETLDEQEKANYSFLIEPRDIYAGDTTPVWKRRLSGKTIRDLMDEAIEPVLNDPGTRWRVNGAARTYSLEITNPYVETTSVIVESGYPQAWTEAYTPKFTVPPELGPHIVKEEVDKTGETGRVAEYDDDVTYMHREFPEEPYGGQVTAAYMASEDMGKRSTTNYTATGTAIATTRITTTTPVQTTSKTSDIDISWWDAWRAATGSFRGDPLTAGALWEVNLTDPPAHKGHRKPIGITPWADRNYYTNDWGPGHLCFPYWGPRDKVQQGSTGDRVRFIQEALNRFMDAKYINGSKLAVDGNYGATTKQRVLDFQEQMQARWKDGVVDAETYSLIGIQIHRLAANNRLGSVSDNNYTKWFADHVFLQPHRVSNGSNTWVAKRSWSSGGPSIIWELYAIRFPESYNWHGVTVVPYAPGDTDSIMVRSVHVGDNTDMRNFNSTRSQLKYLPYRPKNGESLYIPFGPHTGDTITLGVGQDKSSGWGDARVFGVRDIRGHTRVTTFSAIPSSTVVSHQQQDINFTVTGNTTVESMKTKSIQLQSPSWPQYHSVNNIKFTGITVGNPDIVATISSSGLAEFTPQIVHTNTGAEVLQGDKFPAPGFEYYSMNEDGVMNPGQETGWVSKREGMKLLCDIKKKPVGFPSMPTGVSDYNAQRHYVKLTLGTSGTSTSVQMGFYDFNKNEFIISADGRPEISFIEYLTRGPHNIYIAVITDYEKTVERIVPEDDDAPRLPYRWAMPIYGVETRAGSKITLESLPDRLGPRDIWPIAVRSGRFNREVLARERWQGGITTYLKDYQGTSVHAFYSIPEAELGGYSKKFGPPNMDVINEEPMILDDDLIQVRQAPILLAKYPTIYPNESDPVRPVFVVSKREDRDSPWEEIPFSQIRDYNVATGEIFLRQRLQSNDSSLLRVDYTTTSGYYAFKRDEDLLLNLNAYSGHTRDLIGEAIYVYIVPHYVKDDSGRVIPESLQQKTLRVTLDPGVFDPMRPEYDPLAIQLGVVYISTALDISRLGILDTRRRGGGVADSANVKEITRLVNDASTYWDVGYATGSSYQKSGYIVIRLPDQLREEFSENEIVDVVKRNIGAGVGFKLETLQGEDW